MKPPTGNPLGLNLGYRIGAAVLLPIMNYLTKREWLDTEKVPKSGPVIFCSNHISYADPIVFAHYIYKNGRAMRFIGKISVFRIPVVGWVLYKAEQIPVERESASAAHALHEAVEALKMGHAIGMYPEGTLTRDPDSWPMTGKTGAVRLALISGAPLIPVAQWGAQQLLPPYSKRLRIFPRTKVIVKCGDPIDLSKWRGKYDDHQAMHEASDYVMSILTTMVAELRNETPPAHLFDMRNSDLPRTGNFRKNRRR